MAFRDMPNDLPLFAWAAWAGWAVAVANAHPIFLNAADEVAPPTTSVRPAPVARLFC